MKNKLPLYILLVFLIIVNGFFLFQYLGESDRKELRIQENFIEDKLEFSKSQSEDYKKILKDHRSLMESFKKEIMVSKDAFFNYISKTDVKLSEVDSLASIVSNLEKKKDLEIFRHFREVYDMCKEQQKENFKGLVRKSLHQGGRPNREGPPRGDRSRGERPRGERSNDGELPPQHPPSRH